MKRVLLLIFAMGALTSYSPAQNTIVQTFQDSEITVVQTFQYSAYGNCGLTGDPETFVLSLCRFYHPVAINLAATGWCLGETCFEMSYGEHIRIVAADELGDFPKLWFAWLPEGEHLVNIYPGDKCLLQEQGVKKTRVTIPSDAPIPRCKTELLVGPYRYHEHFASNSSTRCLGWIECREDVVP